MKRFLVVILSLCLSLGFTNTAAAQVPVPDINARAWLLLDMNSGQIIASREASTPIEPASLTKLMSAYLVFTALKQKTLSLQQTVPVSQAAYGAVGSRMFIEPRKPVTVNELLHGLIIQSGNDATIALAESVGAGSEANFVKMMNREAQRMKLTQTHFVNSTGLPDPHHVSTAHDLSILVTYLINDFPEFYPLYSQHEYTYNKIRQPNRNRLLSIDPTVDGVKTGHTENAGFCLIASAKRDQRRLLSVVLGTPTENARTQESLKLLNYGFQYFDAVKLYTAQQVVSTPQVWKGEKNNLKIGFMQDRYITVPKGSADRLKAQLALPKQLLAPLTAGQVVGKLRLTLDGKLLQELPLFALEDIPSAGLFGRAWDTLKLWVK